MAARAGATDTLGPAAFVTWLQLPQHLWNGYVPAGPDMYECST